VDEQPHEEGPMDVDYPFDITEEDHDQLNRRPIGGDLGRRKQFFQNL
jgi:hypothetical protein